LASVMRSGTCGRLGHVGPRVCFGPLAQLPAPRQASRLLALRPTHPGSRLELVRHVRHVLALACSRLAALLLLLLPLLLLLLLLVGLVPAGARRPQLLADARAHERAGDAGGGQARRHPLTRPPSTG
jgi:hypothetical protein